MKIKEHDVVVLTQDLPEERLTAGDVGTVIHVHDGGAGYEVEFMTLSRQWGQTRLILQGVLPQPPDIRINRV